ncbi:MAG: hypothetical protein PHR16_11395 [Methylovulum sp.]|nr:hypothetical protein [Methylovulum sp.]
MKIMQSIVFLTSLVCVGCIPVPVEQNSSLENSYPVTPAAPVQTERTTTVIQDRNGVAFLPNETEPFTGKYLQPQYNSECDYISGKPSFCISKYDNGQKESETTFYEDGKIKYQTKFYQNGQKKSEGGFKNERPDGLWTSWHENGYKKSEVRCKFSDSIPYDGLSTQWDINGQKRVENSYKDGKFDGLWLLWDEKGIKLCEAYYQNGTLIKVNNYFPENLNQKNEKTRITGALQTRNGIAYLPNETQPFTGKLQHYHYEADYKNGKQDGLVTEWYENGQKSYEQHYKDDEVEGLWTNWYENGQKKNEQIWHKGHFETLKEWDQNGFLK